MRKVCFIAHRGLSGTYPENTMLAFQKAWQADCDGIELDIQVTKDAQVVVIHDPNTMRTGVESLIISETDFSELKHINVGQFVKGKPVNPDQHIHNQKIPLLLEVINDMPTGKTIQIEIKHQITNIQAVIDCLTGIRSDIVVQIISYQPIHLLTVKQALPHFDYYLVMDKDEPPIDDRISFAVQNGLNGLDMDYTIATPEYIQQVLDAKLKVAHWTVNTIADAKRVIKQGAQYIASDFADTLKQDFQSL